MRKILKAGLVVLAGALLVMTGCSDTEEAQSEESGSPLKVVYLVNGTLGDKSFFDSAHNGMVMIQDKYGDRVETRTVEMSYDETKWEPTLLDIVDEDWDIVILGTWQMTEMLQDVAADHPEKRFVLFDSSVDYSLGMENVYSIEYKQNQASFVAGALAASISNSDMPLANDEKMIGFLGGQDTPGINDFLVGYIQGALYIDPDMKVAVSYVGSYSDSAKGKEMALAQYRSGVDIGYNVAGQSGLGQLDAAREMNCYAIGVDSDQAEIFRETDPQKAALIVTSVLKRVDISLLRAVDMHFEGTTPYGERESLGFAEECVGLSRNDMYQRLVSESMQDIVDGIQQGIQNGVIVVDTALGMDSDTLNELRYSVRP